MDWSKLAMALFNKNPWENSPLPKGELSERIMDTYTSSTVSIPPLAMLPKDHKVVEGPIPAARPVCLCTSSINLRPSDILSEVLTPIARVEGRGIESESTEESLFHIDEANRKVREEYSRGEDTEGELVIGSYLMFTSPTIFLSISE